MVIIGIILSFVDLGFLCWLPFSLAANALPVFVGATAGFAAQHTGSVEIGAMLIGVIAGLAARQIAVAVFRLPIVRTALIGAVAVGGTA